MNQQILKAIIAKWGVENQTNKIQEQALELALVLNQLKCPTKDKAALEAALYDELADMKIMMAQAELLFDADRINERVEFKLNRVVEKYGLMVDEPNSLTLQEYAEKHLDGLYDSRFDEESQCSGWHELKSLVQRKPERITEDLLFAFHPLLRPHLVKDWGNIRQLRIQ